MSWNLTRYERELADVFDIQDEIAQAIVENLRVQFASGRPLIKRYTENLEAYNLYLKGRFHWNKRTADGLARSKDYFEQAIALDPDYAPAYAGLGSWYWMSGFWGFIPPREAMPRAKTELLKALELDDSLADAHAVMGCIRGTYEYEWQEAGRDFARAVELDPTSSFVAERYAVFYLRPMKRPVEAEDVIRRALTTDPLSVPTNGFLGVVLMDQREYDQAIEQFQTTIDMDPNLYFAYFQIAQVYVQKELFDEAISAAERAVESSGRVPTTVGWLGWAYAVAGRTVEARELLSELVKTAQRTYLPILQIGMIHMALGELDQAFERLEESIEQRVPPTVFVNTEPLFDPLRSDPRYHALIRKMNLEP